MYNLLELLVWGRKSKTYKKLFGIKKNTRSYQRRTENRMYLVLPRDVAISVLNDVTRYGMKG
jgi:hypothetical protein